MKKINFFVLFWILTGIVLLIASLFYKKQSDAIVAEVESQKIAISFQKAVKIKAIHVIPGEDVKKGDLLVEVVQPDLVYDLEKAVNDLNTFLEEKELLNTNLTYEIRVTELEKASKIESIDNEIAELRILYEKNENLKNTLKGVELYNDTVSGNSENTVLMQIDFLSKKREQTIEIYNQMIDQMKKKKENELDILDLRIGQQRKEIELLESETNYLRNYAPVDGTIGDVSAQLGELISPYTTVLSLYEINPTVIKAYMNEKNRYNIAVGDTVFVESANRNYNITGYVIEIGSRIVSYPARLLEVQDRRIWGQEIFVKIPENNQFLNGEKVYVRAR